MKREISAVDRENIADEAVPISKPLHEDQINDQQIPRAVSCTIFTCASSEIPDDHLSKMNDGKHVYGANCIKGWIPLAVIIALTTASVLYGIADIIKMSHRQHKALPEGTNLNLSLQSVNRSVMLWTRQMLSTHSIRHKDQSNWTP
ncbi:uncharacterized protein LOC128170644 [Crassostrea angulata]|uniref:uncharacterized protein LOC128170644 n=1 Tax=Magallana angulata TaxID=2784310 RepID=UPI0022B13037|nr:uncharacterized protein LOC128170644 [Crassostrea angulata]